MTIKHVFSNQPFPFKKMAPGGKILIIGASVALLSVLVMFGARECVETVVKFIWHVLFPVIASFLNDIAKFMGYKCFSNEQGDAKPLIVILIIILTTISFEVLRFFVFFFATLFVGWFLLKLFLKPGKPKELSPSEKRQIALVRDCLSKLDEIEEETKEENKEETKEETKEQSN